MELSRVTNQPTWLLSRAAARSHRILSEVFASNGVRGYHVRLLAALDQYGDVSQAELGRYAGIDKSDVVAALNELVEMGLAKRAPDPTDRRRNTISLTRKGRSRLEGLDPVIAEIQDAVLAPLNSQERQVFVQLLEKLTTPDQTDSARRPGVTGR